MTCRSPGRVLLAVLTLAACSTKNPGFMFDTNTTGASTGGETTTTPTSTAADASTTGSDTLTTTDGITGSGPTATSDDPSVSTTMVASASATSEATVGGSSPDATTDAPCVPMMDEFPAEADAFFIAGGTEEGQTCMYLDPIIGSGQPCNLLNFGKTVALRLIRSGSVYEGMYAVRFAQSDLAGLADKVETATAELVLTMYGASLEPVTLRVGKISGPWAEGMRNGTLADGGDSSFAEREHGFAANPWSEPVNDGPRGASTEVAKISVPAMFVDHEQFASEEFPIDDWLAAPQEAQGLAVSFVKNDGQNTKGPGIKANDFPDEGFRPFLRVHYCAQP